MWLMCDLTVAGLRKRVRAMFWFESPSAISRRTSASRTTLRDHRRARSAVCARRSHGIDREPPQQASARADHPDALAVRACPQARRCASGASDLRTPWTLTNVGGLTVARRGSIAVGSAEIHNRGTE